MPRFVRSPYSCSPSTLVRAFAFSAMAWLCATAAFAQAAAVIEGIVSDAQSGVLPGVSMTLRNTETGVLRSTVSEADGRYRFAGLPPGTYDLRAELAGFAAVDVKGTTLTIGLQVKRDVRMTLESLQETVTVVGQTPGVETTQSEVSQVVTQQQIEMLPVNNQIGRAHV